MLNRLVANTPDVLYSLTFTDPPRIDFVSKSAQALTGYSIEQILSGDDQWWQIIHPDDKTHLLEAFQQCKRLAQPFEVNYRLVCKDGSICQVFDRANPIFDSKGQVVGIDGVIIKLPENSEKNALQKTESDSFAKITTIIPALLYQFVLQTNGNIKFISLSQNCEEILGIRPEKITADTTALLDHIFPEDRIEFARLIARSSERLTPFRWQGRLTLNEQTRWFYSVALPKNLENADILWDGILIDITDCRDPGDELDRLADFVANNPEPLLQISSDHTILYANQAAQFLLDAWDTAVDAKLPDNIADILFDTSSTHSEKFADVRCKGRVFSIAVIPVPNRDCFNLFATDVTEAKFAEARAIEAKELLREHDRLKSEFVSTVSHELRTPLCIFKNIVSNAMVGVMGKVSHRLYESLKMADLSIDRISRIIADFLDISKIESGSMKLDIKPLNIQTVVLEIVDSLQNLAAAKGIELETKMPKNTITIKADEERISQILTNLIGNAIKFIPVNGHVNVTMTETPYDIEVAVQDDGPGLSKDDVERVFDRFVQIHTLKGAGEHGTGLGLTITKELVEMHDGRIWVDSKPGQGSCFSFVLPKAGPQTRDITDIENLALNRPQNPPEGES